mmetsp:Transcript_923/g.3389  ORF Transcript_923/g.3389 Transcript_923/m.3389 type:complete len:268 (-) Transcript_923:88-891(-)
MKMSASPSATATYLHKLPQHSDVIDFGRTPARPRGNALHDSCCEITTRTASSLKSFGCPVRTRANASSAASNRRAKHPPPRIATNSTPQPSYHFGAIITATSALPRSPSTRAKPNTYCFPESAASMNAFVPSSGSQHQYLGALKIPSHSSSAARTSSTERDAACDTARSASSSPSTIVSSPTNAAPASPNASLHTTCAATSTVVATVRSRLTLAIDTVALPAITRIAARAARRASATSGALSMFDTSTSTPTPPVASATATEGRTAR